MNIKLVAAAAACVTVVGGSITGISIANSPKVVMAKALTGVVEDVLERDEIKPIYNMFQGGSLEASISTWKTDDINYLEGDSFSGKMYFSKDALMLEDVKVQVDTFKVEGSMYISSDMVYVEEEKILDGAYGIKMDTLAEDLDNSIFAYGSGSKYEISDKELYNQLLDALESSKSTKKMQKDAEKIAKRYAKKIGKIINKNAEFSSKGEKEKLNGEKKNVRQITMTIDDEALSNIVEEVYEFMLDDESLIEYFEKYEDQYAVLFSNSEYDSIAEWYEETLEGFEDYIDDLCDVIEDEFETLEIMVCTPKMSSKLLKLEVEYDGDTMFVLDVGPKGIKKTDTITVELFDTELSYKIKTNTKKSYKSMLELDGEEIATLNIDRDRGKYKVEFDGVELSGTIERDGDAIMIELDEIVESYGGSVISKTVTDLAITIQQKDKMPSVPKDYDTIADISEKDVDKWIKKVEDAFN